MLHSLSICGEGLNSFVHLGEAEFGEVLLQFQLVSRAERVDGLQAEGDLLIALGLVFTRDVVLHFRDESVLGDATDPQRELAPGLVDGPAVDSRLADAAEGVLLPDALDVDVGGVALGGTGDRELAPFRGGGDVFVGVEVGDAGERDLVDFGAHLGVAGTEDGLDAALLVQFEEFEFFIVKPDHIRFIRLELDFVYLVDGQLEFFDSKEHVCLVIETTLE